ncbi:MAG: YraN family protein [Desulfomonilaceae bacterium]
MIKADEQHTRARGMRAEDIASKHLEKLGYRVVERNFMCKVGEIDLIAQHDGTLVFVEVRSRRDKEAVDPIYSVDVRKQKKLVRTAQFYLATRFSEYPICRFDVVIVTLGKPPDIMVLQDAFSE